MFVNLRTGKGCLKQFHYKQNVLCISGRNRHTVNAIKNSHIIWWNKHPDFLFLIF